MTAEKTSSKRWLTRNVVALSLVSLFNDTASEMVAPLLPVFLTSVVGGTAMAVGWMEGVAEAIASILKLASGWWADRRSRKMPLVAGGYALANIVRPLIAVAGATWHVLLLRALDRTGKGLRASPRDALLAASTPPERRGAAFGLNRGLDHAGAVLGPLLAALIMGIWTQNLRIVFLLSAIPGLIAVGVLVFGVRESKEKTENQENIKRNDADDPVSYRPLLRFLLPLGLFTLGNASDLFILLKAQAANIAIEQLPLLWMFFHVVKSATAFPSGWIADFFGYRKVIAAGWFVYGLVYAGFAFTNSPGVFWGLFIAYGCYHGLTEAAEKALVSQAVPPKRRGTGFGWYHLTIGIFGLVANVLFGALWQYGGGKTAFLASAALAISAVAALIVANMEHRQTAR